MVEVRKAVIPAAGLGTGFLPATRAMPKEMLPIIDKPIIQHVVEEAIAAGIDDILIVTGRGKRAVEDHFDRNPELENTLLQRDEKAVLEQMNHLTDKADIFYVRQKEPKGLGHAIGKARKHVGREPFVVMLGDTITPASACTKPIIELYKKHKSPIIGVEEVPIEMSKFYGMVGGKKLDDGVWEINSMIEKPEPKNAPGNLAIWGRYLLTPEIFDFIEKTKPGAKGEIQLTDAMSNHLKSGQKYFAYVMRDKRYDIGKRLQYFKAFVEFALERPDIGRDAREYLKGLKL
jgi:UTP--glucose-1-phosphate uridylyltransferase